MYKALKRTCWAIVLPIRSIVFPRSRCRNCRGLLKVRILFLSQTRINYIFDRIASKYAKVESSTYASVT